MSKKSFLVYLNRPLQATVFTRKRSSLSLWCGSKCQAPPRIWAVLLGPKEQFQSPRTSEQKNMWFAHTQIWLIDLKCSLCAKTLRSIREGKSRPWKEHFKGSLLMSSGVTLYRSTSHERSSELKSQLLQPVNRMWGMDVCHQAVTDSLCSALKYSLWRNLPITCFLQLFIVHA